jgi:hypothetical protein
MTNLHVSTKTDMNFSGRKNVFAADANLPQTWPHTRRKHYRKYCRKHAINRKAVEPRNYAGMTRAMARKHCHAEAVLARYRPNSRRLANAPKHPATRSF